VHSEGTPHTHAFDDSSNHMQWSILTVRVDRAGLPDNLKEINRHHDK
jgi:hypothetical protein